jgi:hypothetical protein
MSIALTLTSAATMMVISNAQGTTNYSLGEEALGIAESGADNAILRLLRDPNYAGESMTVGSGTATMTVTGGGTKTIISTGSNGSFTRTIQVVGTLSGNTFALSSWNEI